MKKELSLLCGWMRTSSNVVVFTGAGMSTESGLPDFRSANGMWKNVDPRELASIRALNTNTREFYNFYKMRIEALEKAEPHDGHFILANWENKNRVKHIITQNVDGFHQKAGSKSVSELHGSLRISRCQDCGREYSAKKILERDFPRCEACSGKLRPGVVLFGESLPLDALEMADTESSNSELFIVIGSSLEVSPANYFPVKAKNSGARLAIINLDDTNMDDYADVVIRGKTKEVLQELDHMISVRPSF
ncbi:MAG: NAD-dependent deacylase [Eubacteriales bacterium]|jgi:NAD-dependent deacetylase|nr:NAD-dependent deacylase [Eubacteriales bacterium]